MNQKYLTTLLADETVFEAEATPFGPVTNFWGIPEKKFEACRPNEEVNELESKLQKNQNFKIILQESNNYHGLLTWTWKISLPKIFKETI